MVAPDLALGSTILKTSLKKVLINTGNADFIFYDYGLCLFVFIS